MTNSTPKFQIEYLAAGSLVPDPRNSRRHPKAQLARLKAAIGEFGLNVPILVDEQNAIIAGHARLIAAQSLGMEQVPCVRLTHLTSVQKRALAIADNKIAELAEWDPDALRAEFAALCALDFPVELTGFATAEIDFILETPVAAPLGGQDPADVVDEPDRRTPAVTQPGDCWLLGEHRSCCGNALETASYQYVLGDARAAMVISDVPYNVPIQGHVSGLGKAAHPEFAMASGEMSPEEFTAFLAAGMTLMVEFSTDGSLHFIFMDWRHISEISAAGTAAYAELKALCVWDKKSGGMGSLYRSQHELIFVYKNGTAPHQNNILLGKYGRYRTNLWSQAGANSFGRTRDADLAAHPTVKPIALIADAIRDCSKRGDIILDPFAGSGTIILAAERTGRRAAAIEIDPHYVDVGVRRWQSCSGKSATLMATGKSFEEVAAKRSGAAQQPPAIIVDAEAGHE